MEKIEKKTSKTILQDPMSVKIGNRVFLVRPVTLASMIRISELISELDMDELDPKDPIHSVLRNAKDCSFMASIIAVAIVGEKKVSFVRRFVRNLRIAMISRYVESNCTPKEINELIVAILGMFDVSDFFAITTFLRETNVTKRTKVG